MKREYPLFIIDRTKSENYPNDYIVCLDRECGFVAQVFYFPKDEMFAAFMEKMHSIENAELAGCALPLGDKRGGVVLQIVDFLYYFEISNQIKNRVKILAKKALKKYLHAETDRTAYGDLGIENQIKQMELNLEHNLRNYDELVSRANDKQYADYMLDLTRATIQTLKNWRDNVIIWNTNLK